jgi:hypothetical protein
MNTKCVQIYKYEAVWNKSEIKNRFNWYRPVDLDKYYSKSKYWNRELPTSFVIR